VETEWKKYFHYGPNSPDNSYTSDPSTDYQLELPGDDEWICSYAAIGSRAFFMAYTAMFDQLWICFPFSDFQVEVLHNLHLAPSQLHPKGWAFLQAFEVFCWANEWKYSSSLFLYLFGPIEDLQFGLGYPFDIGKT
jgi:hypothetical protein